MSTGQEKDSGLQGDARMAKDSAGAARNVTGAARNTTGGTSTGPGTTAGAAATGSTTTTTTTTAVREREGTSAPPASYGRTAEPSTSYRSELSTSGMTGGVISVLTGLLTFLAGLAAVVRSSFYPGLPLYAYRWTPHNWGWVLVGLGIVLFAAGACALLGMAWARVAAIALSILTAVGGFMFLAYSPVWGTILVLLSVVAIWGLLRDHGQRSSV